MIRSPTPPASFIRCSLRHRRQVRAGQARKEPGCGAVCDTVHEVIRDEASHGKAFEGLLKWYFEEKGKAGVQFCLRGCLKECPHLLCRENSSFSNSDAFITEQYTRRAKAFHDLKLGFPLCAFPYYSKFLSLMNFATVILFTLYIAAIFAIDTP